MTQKSFPWDSQNGDRLYNAQDFKDNLKSYLKSGVVISNGSGLAVSAVSGMNVKLGTGSAVLQGTTYSNDEEIGFKINLASTIQSRTDSVVLRFDNTVRDIYYLYKSNDVTVIRTDDIWELQLATILVPVNATEITQSNITDKRSDSKVCGYATPYDNVPVDGLITQYKSLFKQADTNFQSWFKNLQNQLNDNQVTNLQGQINQSITDKGELPKGTDLNSFFDMGFYALNYVDHTSTPNLPPNFWTSSISKVGWGHLLVYNSTKDTGSMTIQEAQDLKGTRFTRLKANSEANWTDWVKDVTSDSSGNVQISGTLKVQDLKVNQLEVKPIARTIKLEWGIERLIVRYGNLVTFNGESKYPVDIITKGWETINEKIPVGFRPVSTERLVSLDHGGNSRTFHKISPDGSIQRLATTKIYKDTWYISPSTTWITNDPFPE